MFMANFTDGYSLRNTICMIKNETEEMTLNISKTTISILFINKGQYAMHHVDIKTNELSEYHYHIDRDEYPITINSAELFNATKSVGRKDSLKIYWDGEEKLIIQPIKLTKEPGRCNVSYINIIHKEANKIESINCHYNDPTIMLQNREFYDICNQASTLKCIYLEITAFTTDIYFKGVLANGKQGMESHFPISCKEEKKELIKIKIPISTLKTLSKLHNISTSGTLLKFYFIQDNPVCIDSKIGAYGVYKIYLRDYKMIK